MAAVYSQNQAMFRDNPIMFLLMILLIPVFGLGLLVLLIWYIRTKTTLLEIDASGKVSFVRGILSKDRVELDARSIRSVRVKQSLFQRIFGTGDIMIFT